MQSAVKRLSLGLHSPRLSSQHRPVTLDMKIESPPLMMYNSPATSTGALLSGILKLRVNEDRISFDGECQMSLAMEVTHKAPFHAHCDACSHQVTELQKWKFMQGPATFKRGEHTFPFSFLLPGHLPASLDSRLTRIEYVLRASITPRNAETIKYVHVLEVKRAICPAEQPRKSFRIFPPTNLTANCDLPSVIYPIGDSTVALRIDGCVKRNPETKSQTQWRLKRINWRLDETATCVAPSCLKHGAKWTGMESLRKGVARKDVRNIGAGEIKTGWKSDYTSADGTIEMEFPLTIRPDADPICDTKAEDDVEVSHVLVVEMIVAEEFCRLNKLSYATATGAARILRMHFNITVTQRAGMGISWDEEQPPLYENVPASPPGYNGASTEDYFGEDVASLVRRWSLDVGEF
ncbi:hypothetical protein LZ554_004370 [Drepanopeziza brunnea f. sp. 'monogermtubi']|nr:hypothetical protein LZ554_004370 [Drepanopeziza brunnea f. sp. 'monogermtubi']